MIAKAVILSMIVSGTCFGAGSYSWTDVTGTLRGKPSSVTGTATLLLFGQRIPMQYSLDSAGRFNANGSWNGTNTGWKTDPNLPGSEYRITNPRLSVSVSNTPATLTPKLSIGSLELRTIARRADGTPLAQAVINPAQIQVAFDGTLTLPLPRFPLPQPIISNPFCEASCGFLRGVNMPGNAIRFNGKIAVPAGTYFPNGRLDYVDMWHNQCEIHRMNIRRQDVGTGECKSDSICLPGQNREQGNQPTRCVTPVPTVPQLPNAINMNIEQLLR
jgi:hypothetical protein